MQSGFKNDIMPIMKKEKQVVPTDLEQVKNVIAENLVTFRKKANLTQQELAEFLNYSDKAVSKWERAEGTPDIFVLKFLADLYGITVNDFLVVHAKPKVKTRSLKAKRLLVTLLSTGLVWLIATIVTVAWLLVDNTVPVAKYAYLVAWPVSMIVLLVFTCMWGRIWQKCVVVSALIWSLCVLLHIVLRVENSWLIYVVGAALQLLVILWYILRFFVLKDRQKKQKIK